MRELPRIDIVNSSLILKIDLCTCGSRWVRTKRVRNTNDLVFKKFLEALEILLAGSAHRVQVVNSLEEI